MKIGHSQAEDESVNFKNELKIKHRDDKMLGGFDSEVKFDNSGKCAAESTWDGPFRQIEGMEKSSLIANCTLSSKNGA